MARNVILYKEILFGLRKEYLRNQKALNELKKLIKCTNTNFENYDFYLYHPEGKQKLELMLYITKRQSKIVDMMQRFISGEVDDTILQGSYVNNNGEYYLGESFEVINHSEFRSALSDILLDDFAKNMKKKAYRSYTEGSPDVNITIEPSGITSSHRVKNNVSVFKYSPIDDTFNVRLMIQRPEIIQQHITEMLNTPFPTDVLNEYQYNALVNNGAIGTDVEVRAHFSEEDFAVKLDIEQHGRKLLLKRNTNNNM